MAWKDHTQQSFADGLLIEHDALLELDGINKLIDWHAIEAQLRGIYNKAEGNLSFPPLLMFKALLLQSWYALSDPALEKQLARDLMFRRFVGLNLSDAIPDRSTIWRFRRAIEKAELVKPLLDTINNQLNQKGLLIRHGTVSIIDATVIEAQRARPNKDKDGNNTQDPEAAWNVKTASDGKTKTTYGFKGHANVDEDGFIKAFEFTAGNVHDSNVFTELLGDTDSAAYADAAYASAKHDAELEARHIENRIMKRAYRNTPLTAEQKAFNRLHAGTRSTVERVFGVLKQHYRAGKARYIGLKRNTTRFGLMCIAHNVKRGFNLLNTSVA